VQIGTDAGTERDPAIELTSAGGTGAAVKDVVRELGCTRVLDGVSFEVRPPGRLGIVGRSGSGRSTLRALIAGLDEPDSGSIAIAGRTAAAGHLSRCALMPQRDYLLPWRSALDNAALALENVGLSRQDARERTTPLSCRRPRDHVHGGQIGHVLVARKPANVRARP
jgi:NitT/TauT family transport system ATP-binding protein